jgi:hypothetical protein
MIVELIYVAQNLKLYQSELEEYGLRHIIMNATQELLCGRPHNSSITIRQLCMSLPFTF